MGASRENRPNFTLQPNGGYRKLFVSTDAGIGRTLYSECGRDEQPLVARELQDAAGDPEASRPDAGGFETS
jgi:hypothetical protein